MNSSVASFALKEATDANYIPGIVDTIILHARKNRISKRQIASLTGINKARIQRILSDDQSARYEARTSELGRIVKAIGMSSYDALVSEEIGEMIRDEADIIELLPFLSNILNGLVSEIACEIRSIDGIVLGACKTVHAEAMRKRLAKLVGHEMRRFFERQEALYADMEQGGTRARIYSSYACAP
ncbi:hypothetical protein [Sphingomonas sp. Leaf4]|uniref:hypothetical protein n=1 Tax=Sphingomonas sp. Leaf4 TaxID=2876553 RepID=UPI001E642AEE|nr:hypothetical protein [Sphingomonas sp. Leaf4]